MTIGTIGESVSRKIGRPYLPIALHGLKDRLDLVSRGRGIHAVNQKEGRPLSCDIDINRPNAPVQHSPGGLERGRQRRVHRVVATGKSLSPDP